MVPIGDKIFLNLHGTQIIELPPLIFNDCKIPANKLTSHLDDACINADRVFDEEITPYKNKLEIGVNLFDLYVKLRRRWIIGNSFLEWIRNCRINRSFNDPLTPFLASVWPHNLDTIRFYDLYVSKSCVANENEIEIGIGVRTAYEKLPKIGVFTADNLIRQENIYRRNFYDILDTFPKKTFLPPERFDFQIINL